MLMLVCGVVCFGVSFIPKKLRVLLHISVNRQNEFKERGPI